MRNTMPKLQFSLTVPIIKFCFLTSLIYRSYETVKFKQKGNQWIVYFCNMKTCFKLRFDWCNPFLKFVPFFVFNIYNHTCSISYPFNYSANADLQNDDASSAVKSISYPGSIAVAAFNVQVFGRKKMSKQRVAEKLTKVFALRDINILCF